MNPTVYDVIKPKRPTGDGWTQKTIPAHLPLARSEYPVEAWLHKEGFLVYSAVEVAEKEIGAEYHVSVSKCGARCSLEEGLWVCNEFGIPEADEDNHVPGIARHYWRPVADTIGDYVCPCKDEETAIVEGDYVYRPLPEGK